LFDMTLGGTVARTGYRYLPFALLTGMALALALFYWGGSLAPAPYPALLGVAVFAALAAVRPDLALVFVPLTVPLYLIPAALSGIRAAPFRLPLHEAALLATAAATLASVGLRFAAGPRPTIRALALRDYAPHALFFLAGLLGVLVAIERARALREFRWVIAEPLVFLALVLYQTTHHRNTAGAGSERSPILAWLVAAFVLSGTAAGAIGLLQYVGLDIAPLLGQKQCFATDGGPCTNIVEDGGLRRVLSVYGHPNNLGLYLGRVWPLAAALALAGLRPTTEDQRRRTEGQGAIWTDKRRLAILALGLAALICLGGIVVSFSRGAWLGALAAGAILVLGFRSTRHGDTETRRHGGKMIADDLPVSPSPRRPVSLSTKKTRWAIGASIALAVLAGLALSIRGDVTAGSTPVRLLLWREALAYMVQHPLGIGLDQFGFYHDPASGRSLIDPSLIGTSEQYAAHPHNLLLDIGLRLGPLGWLAFGWLLARFFRAARAQADAPRVWERGLALGGAAAMVAALTHGMVDNFYFVPDLAIAFWLLIALIDRKEHQ
jgi:putative inorganic carbon (HCO3(-)) transporter